MLSYVDHDTQMINEDSDENDSKISQADSHSQADDLDTAFHATEESPENEEEKLEDSTDEQHK